MNYKDRKGNLIVKETNQDKFLKSLYTKKAGRFAVRLMITRPVTNMSAFFLKKRPSVIFINRFIKKNNIDISLYEPKKYKSYNDFFTRRMQPGKRIINDDPNILVSPCDGKATAFVIDEKTCFTVKNTKYTVSSLLKNSGLAQKFSGGTCVLIRLTVDDYHRYVYPCDGVKEENVIIPGVLHTVNPIASEYAPIYKENSREYTLCHSYNFGDVIHMEVGALIVGKISNHHMQPYQYKKGEEKGFFEFGGSSVILLLEKGKVQISPDIIKNTEENCETIVKLGEEIGKAPTVTSE